MKFTISRERLIALAVTAVVALMLLLWLMVATLGRDKEALTKMQPPIEEEQEIFIDPELLTLGEPDAVTKDKPAPAPSGQPEQSETPSDKLVVPGEKTEPSQSTEKLVSTTHESTLQTKEPTKTEEPESKISSTMKDKFSPKNGKTEGNDESVGAGGTGCGVAGSVNGRSFLGCSLPSVSVNKAVTIYVSITVDENGKVIEARFKSDKGAGAGNQTLRNACVKASYNARWSVKKGEPRATGTITWNLRPRK